MIRELTSDDLSVASSMVGLKPRTSGTSPITQQHFVESFGQYFLGNDNTKAFGYFQDGELICFLCVGFFESKMRGKFWVIPALYTKNFKPIFNFKDPDMALLLKYAFEYAESKNYYEFYYSVSARIVNAYERQWQRNSVMPTGRYDLITLETVPPNTKPEFELYWRLMGEEEKPDPIIIKKRVLKESYRKKGKTILYTPLDIPKIEPNNWDEWWAVWKTCAETVIKVKNNHNDNRANDEANTYWRGLELYRYTEQSDVLDQMVYRYARAPDVPVVRDIVKQITNAFPNNVCSIVVLENIREVPFHTDGGQTRPHVRTLLWSSNTLVNWILLDDNVPWPARLPQETNTFAYLDNPMQHCALYYPTHTKGLIQIHLLDRDPVYQMMKDGADKFKGYTWHRDEE